MRSRYESQNRFTSVLNLDSLVDIVSNSVGILVILAVFTAMFSMMDSTSEKPEEEVPYNTIEKLRIPWSHATQKNGLLLLIRDDRVLFLDRTKVYQKMKQMLKLGKAFPPNFQLGEYDVELTAGGGYAHCLEFFPASGSGQWWHQFVRSDGVMQAILEKYKPEESYFFFWVDPNSFELFREVRKELWDQSFEVGWKPVRKKSPLRYCSGDGQSRSFQPQ